MYDDCHVIMAAQKLSVNRLFHVERTCDLKLRLCKTARLGKNNSNQTVSIMPVPLDSGGMVVDKDLAASANPRTGARSRGEIT